MASGLIVLLKSKPKIFIRSVTSSPSRFSVLFFQSLIERALRSVRSHSVSSACDMRERERSDMGERLYFEFYNTFCVVLSGIHFPDAHESSAPRL